MPSPHTATASAATPRKLGRVSRSGFYRFDEDAEPGSDPHMDLRDDIQRIALAWPSYGRPRITAELLPSRLDVAD